MSSSARWAGIVACTGLALSLVLGAPARGAEDAQDGDQEASVAQAVSALKEAAGGQALVRTSRTSGLGVFLAAARGYEIPVAGDTAQERALAFVDEHGRAFGLAGRQQLQFLREERDELGMDHVVYQQTHGGVPIAAAHVVFHLREEGLSAVSAKTIGGLKGLSTTPTFPAEQVVSGVRGLLTKRGAIAGLEVSTPRLEVLARSILDGSSRPPRLAWFVEARATALRQYIWVDAERGMVLLQFSQLTDAKRRYIHTSNGTASLPGTLLRSEGGAPVPDTNPNAADANAAYDFSGDTYDYFFEEHGRDSYDGKGAVLRSTVRYCPPTSDPDYECPYGNAFWNGTQMVYGQGFSLADDVDAHELTHAVTEKSADLYYWSQSGALNESFSDIFGEIVDLTNGAGNDDVSVKWQMGEDLPGIGAIRNMMNPNLFSDPARTGDSSYWCDGDDNGGVHSNSGVPNHAFALMADGGTYNSFTITGIGLTKAGKIAYRTLTSYLTYGSNFVDAYHAFRQSCDDLVGTAGITVADCGEVQKALDAVEMDHPTCYQDAQPALCAAGEGPVNVFFDDLELTATGNWTTGTLVPGMSTWTVWASAGSPRIYSTVSPLSGKYHLWGIDPPSRSDAYVATKVFTVPAGAMLHFKHDYSFEAAYFGYFVNYDGGVVEYSVNNGAWTDASSLFSAGRNYDDSPIYVGTNSPIQGRQAFVNGTFDHATTIYNLSSLAGQQVRFRFRAASDICNDLDWDGYCDPGVTFLGWVIDDVRVYSCGTGGEVRMAAATATGSEAAPTATISVTRTGLAEGVTVAYFTNDGVGTAIAGEDYASTAGTVRFASGETSKTFTVPILNDTADDDGEAFEIGLEVANGPGATLGTPATTTVTITDNDVAGSLQFSAATYSVSEAGPVATITVTRTGGAASGVTVGYATVAGGTATDSGLHADYTPVSGTLTFGAGQMSRTFTVPIINDCWVDGPETVNLELSAPGGGGTLGARTTAVLTIVDNDLGGVFQFAAAAYSVSEGVPSAEAAINVVRTGGVACEVSVSYRTSNGSASAEDDDYIATGETLYFGAGETSQTFPVTILNDTVGENNETINLAIYDPTGGSTLGVRTTAILNILEDERVLQFSLANYTVVEGGTATITVRRSGLLTGPVTVEYTTLDGSASAGSDYTTSSGTLSFGSSVVAKTFTVRTTQDTDDERDETVLLSLSSPDGGTLGPLATAVLSVTDNDTAGSVKFNAAKYTVAESATSATITVVRSGGTAGPVAVDYEAVAGGTATDGADFDATAGTLTFLAGQMSKTFTVTLYPDTVGEGAETVSLALSDPTGGLAVVAPYGAVLTITEDDSVVELAADRVAVAEGAPAVAQLKRTGSLAGRVVVAYHTSDGSAVQPADYVARTGSVTFNPGAAMASVAVTTVNDTDDEGDEYVVFTLDSVTNELGASAVLGGLADGWLVINDNDTAGAFKLSLEKYTVSEAAGQVTITVTRTGGVAGNVTVECLVGDASASAGSDYTLPSPNPVVLAFGPGQVTKTFTIPISNDTDPEGAEMFTLTLQNATGGATLGSPDLGDVTITDNDAPVFQFSAVKYTVAETAPRATITVRRVGSATSAATVDYNSLSGDAVDGDDFTVVGGTLTFGVGVLSRTFTVDIINDTEDEPAESFLVQLTAPSAGHYLGSPSLADVFITDNDVAGNIQFAVSNYSVTEGTSSATITVSRTGGTAGGAEVMYATQDGSATVGVDYTLSWGTLTFGAGETSKTFAVPIADDATVEGVETVELYLSPSGGDGMVTIGPRTAAILAIVDND